MLLICHEDGTRVAEYEYDAWGNCEIKYNPISLNNVSKNNIAKVNPFRYRGYYMDAETGYYYLQSRYYDPGIRRFISPDNYDLLPTLAESGDLNLYVYCGNNPVMYTDPTGEFAISAIIIGAIIGAIIGFGGTVLTDYLDDGQVFNGSVAWYDYLGATVLGGVIGAGAGYVLPYISSFASTTFALGGGGLAVSGGGAAAVTAGITITGAQVLGAAGVLGVTYLFAKGAGPRMGHNQHEKQMWNEAMRQLGIKKGDLWQRLHYESHKYPYQDNLKGLINLLREILRKWGKI